METTCTRCHQAVQPGSCYCPVCGLPQLVYSADSAQAPGQPDRWNEAVRDAASVEWKPAMRSVLMLAIPAGIVCPLLNSIGFLGFFLMATAAAWVVILYVRSQRPAWITVGAGARIGLVTGLISSWLSVALIGGSLFSMRYFAHQGGAFDDLWQGQLVPRMVQQWESMGTDSASIALLKSMVLSPEGRAGSILSAILVIALMLLVFSVAGGALGARLVARTRRPEV